MGEKRRNLRACARARVPTSFAHVRGPGTNCEGVGVPVRDGVRVGVCEVVSVPVREMLLVLEKLVLGVRVCVGVLVGVLEFERVTVSPAEAVVEGEKDGEEVKETDAEVEPELDSEMLSLIVGVSVAEGLGLLEGVSVDVRESEGEPESEGGIVAVLLVEPEAEAEGEGVSLPVEEAEPEADAEGVGVCEGVRVGEVSVCELEDVKDTVGVREGVRLPKSDQVGVRLAEPRPEADSEPEFVSERVGVTLGVLVALPVSDAVLLALSEAAPGQRVPVGLGEMPVDCVTLSVGLAEKIGLSLPVSLTLPLRLGVSLARELELKLLLRLTLAVMLRDLE